MNQYPYPPEISKLRRNNAVVAHALAAWELNPFKVPLESVLSRVIKTLSDDREKLIKDLYRRELEAPPMMAISTTCVHCGKEFDLLFGKAKRK